MSPRQLKGSCFPAAAIVVDDGNLAEPTFDNISITNFVLWFNIACGMIGNAVVEGVFGVILYRSEI